MSRDPKSVRGGGGSSHPQADHLADPLIVLHHWYVHRCQSLGWDVRWAVTAPTDPAEASTATTTARSSSSSSHASAATRRGSNAVIHSQHLGEGHSCPYCQRDSFFAAHDARLSDLKDWCRQRSLLSSSFQRGEPREAADAESPLDTRTTRARARLYRSLRERQQSFLTWVAALGVSDGSHTVYECALLPRMARPAAPRVPDLIAASTPHVYSGTFTKTSSAATYKQAIHANAGASADSAARPIPSPVASPVLKPTPLSAAVPLGFACVPSLESITALSSSQVQSVLSLPCFVAGKSLSRSTPPCCSPPALPSGGAEVWLYQRRAKWSSKRKRRTGDCHPLHLGSVVACDVLLIGSNAHTSSSSGNGNSTTIKASSSAATTVFSVWGRLSRGTGAADADKELFFIAEDLEMYIRLGLLFGWVYGWQMCYSSRGPPAASIPWLRLFNVSAYNASETLRGETPTSSHK